MPKRRSAPIIQSMMGETVIACYDGREPGADPIALGGLLARRPGSKLVVAYVYPYEPPRYQGSDDYQAALKSLAEDTLARGARHVPYGVQFETVAVRGRSPEEALADLAAIEGAATLVLGSCHRGPLGRVLLGSVGERLMRSAPCPVTIAPRGYAEQAHRIGTIGVAVDGSRESRLALVRAGEMARELHACIRLMAVLEPTRPGYGSVLSTFTHGSPSGARREDLELALDQAEAAIPDGVPVERELLGGDPAQTLLEGCERGVDLLVSGSRGFGPVRRTFRGGVSAELVRGAGCPVCVVPRSSAGVAASEAA